MTVSRVAGAAGFMGFHVVDQPAGMDREGIALDGNNRMMAWVKERGARATAPVDHIDVAKNLPPSWR